LRQWVEGDDFDYRALLDFAVDRKAGRQPSERLYIKRVKQRRDVAVMLLVDLSRSTSNMVSGSSRSVLDVAKEAIVLFTQALEVVGDHYAVAGFSGTGRLGVDFFRIKDFEEPLDAGVKGTISRLTPQRSTRMGAAVRRATLDLMAQENRVRLLLLIGDGFPNDTAYKDHYAVQDTRQAIAEARSSGVITQAITVNLPTSPRLDELYGPVRHTVISNVQELPDKLLRLYGVLTRA
jgi:nitric oxide reductase activation protein